MIADIAVVLFGVTLLYVSTAGMIESYIKMLTVQGLLLFVIALFSLTEYNVGGIIFSAAETLLLKATTSTATRGQSRKRARCRSMATRASGMVMPVT